MARDPFSWAEQYGSDMTHAGLMNEQNAQEGLMRVFMTEAQRQQPWSDLPVDLAKQNNMYRNMSQNQMANAAFKQSIKGPMDPGKVGQLIKNISRARGVDENFMLTLAEVESGFDPSAQNKDTSAGGLYQFIDDTAAGMGLRNKMDPTASTQAAISLMQQNANALRSAGIEPSPGALYLMHQQGPKAIQLLRNPQADAASIVGADAVRKNGGRVGMSAGQFASMWTRKFERMYQQRLALDKERRSRGTDQPSRGDMLADIGAQFNDGGAGQYKPNPDDVEIED